MSGRQQGPALNENTYMHVTKILRHFGYGAEDITAYVKTLPQPKAKADKAAKQANKDAATAAEAQVEAHAVDAQAAGAAPPAAKGKASKSTATGAGSKGQTKPGHASSGTGAAGGTPHGGATGAAKGSDAAMHAAETLAASDANVIGMVSDDDDLLPVAVTAQATQPGDAPLTGGKRKAAVLAASERPQQGASGCPTGALLPCPPHWGPAVPVRETTAEVARLGLHNKGH